MLESENNILKERCNEYHERLSALEGLGARELNRMRTMNETELPLLADETDLESYDKFSWILPKEALFNATDQAL